MLYRDTYTVQNSSLLDTYVMKNQGRSFSVTT